MPVVVVGNEKGGAGKTTIAVSLAAAWARRGRRIMLVDTDRQQAAAAWLEAQEAVQVTTHAGAGLETLLPQVARQFDAVLVDCPPGLAEALRSAIRVADLLIIPVSPSPADIRSVRPTLELAHELRGNALRVRFVLNRVLGGTVLGRTARDALRQYGVPIYRVAVGQRVALQEAIAEGKPIFDYEAAGKAAKEMRILAQEVWRDAEGPHARGVRRAATAAARPGTSRAARQ
jgi:chromosome partitioning protein